jgi:CSLREA domain-containing protein
MNLSWSRADMYAAKIVCLALWHGFAVQTAHARTITVNNTSDAVDSAPGDGVCETARGNAKCTLRAAIQEANAAGPVSAPIEIQVPTGSYVLRLSGMREDLAAQGDLDINTSVKITGAGRSQTIVDGSGLDRVFDIAPRPRGPIENISVSLAHLTVSEGRSDFSGGGGLRYAGKLTLEDVVVRDNTAIGPGGGLVSTNGSDDDPQLTVVDSLVTHNRASNFGGDGGGIEATFSTRLTVLRSTISENSAAGAGGGVHAAVVAADATFTDSVIRGNIAGAEVGLYVGGGIAAVCPKILRSTISGNRASANGGGLQLTGVCGAEITNSTISGNTAGTSGGGLSNSGTVTLTHVTIADNTARDLLRDAGGGIDQFGRDSRTLLNNTLVAENVPSNCGGLRITSSGHNLDDDASCDLRTAGDLTVRDPGLLPLADNGGFAFTHALRANSPAVDAAVRGGTIVEDERGLPRPADGDGDTRIASDIGAYELGAKKPEPPPEKPTTDKPTPDEPTPQKPDHPSLDWPVCNPD